MREPLQVLVLLYNDDADLQVCVFHRRNSDYWQFIAGGKESTDANLTATVIRELYEETGLTVTADAVIPLETVTSVPASFFRGKLDPNVILVTEHCFAVYLKDAQTIALSREHDRFLVADYDTAKSLLKWDSNKTALYELRARLARKPERT